MNMLTDKEINRINKFLESKTFNYKDLIVPNTEVYADFDYKFKIIGYKKMISVGTEYDYLTISLTLLNFRDILSRIIFDGEVNREKDFWKSYLEDYLYLLKSKLISSITDTMIYFNTDVRIHIGEVMIEKSKKENIQEQKMTKQTIRTVVRDILNVLKGKVEGDFYLPSDSDFYSFSNFPVSFSVELEIVQDMNLNSFKINADYSPEDEVIGVLIVYNPNTLNTNLYDIVGELNEVMAHELEHSLQNYRGELEYSDESDGEELTPLEYYLQPHEIFAQIKGFKRLSKLRRKPIEDVIRQWFDTHKDVHELSKDDEETVINKLINN